MKTKIIVGILIYLATVTTVSAQTKHSTTTKYPSYKGLIMAGYQGWFVNPTTTA